jgi:ligand-binding sensor domain-containing protein/GGDEF domain-containing protein
LASSLNQSINVEPKLYLAHYSIDDGLSLNTITSFAQTHDGFMWIGSEDGLNRFDGYEFKIYKREPGNAFSLPDNLINRLFVDSQGRLWIGTQKGLSLYNVQSDQFKNIAAFDNTNHAITSIVEDIYGRIWVLASNKLLIYQDIDSSLQPFSKIITTKQAFRGDGINGLHVIGSNLYLGKNDCLITLDLHNLNFREKCFGVDSLGHLLSIKTITSNGSDTLWIGTQYGVIRYNLLTQEFLLYQEQSEVEFRISSNLIQDVFVDSLGTTWVATADGLNRFDAHTNSFIQYHQNLVDDGGLLSNDILTVYEDDSGLIWIATYGNGFHIWNRRTEQFKHYLTRRQASQLNVSNAVHGIATDLLDNLWIGSYGDGLFRVNSERTKIDKIVALDSTQSLNQLIISSLHIDIYNNLWIATNEGLYLYDHERLKLLKYEKISGFISSMFEDRNGDLWVGSVNKLYRIHITSGAIEEWKSFDIKAFDDALEPIFPEGDFTVTCIYESIQGLILIGTDRGLLVFEWEDDFKLLARFITDENNSKSISNDYIQVIYEDSQGLIWIGTADGLNRLEYNFKQPTNSYFTQITESEGLSNDSIYGIQSGQDGILWLSSNYGLMSFDPATGKVISFTVKDGLQNNEFNMWASHKSTEGIIYFGGVNGVNSFNPKTLTKSFIRPRLMVTEVKLNGKKVSRNAFLESKLILENENDLLAIKVASLNFYEPKTVRYRYRIEGASNEWYEIGDTRIINIFSLNKGIYSLNIQARSQEGTWISLAKPIQISVHRVFWKSTDALFIYLILFILLISSGFYIWYRKIHDKNLYIKKELENNREFIRHLQFDLEKAKESEEFKQQEIVRLTDRLDYFRTKLNEYIRRDKTTGLYRRKFFESLISKEDEYLSQEYTHFPKGCVITICINNYRNLLTTEYHANIEAAITEFAETLRDFSSGDDLLCRWDDDVFMMLESGNLEQLEIKLYNFYRIIKSRNYDCGNGRLIHFDITMAIVPTPLTSHHTNLLNRSAVFHLSEDLIGYLCRQYVPSVYVFECIDDCHPVEMERRIVDGVEQLLMTNQFKLTSLAQKLVKESA